MDRRPVADSQTEDLLVGTGLMGRDHGLGQTFTKEVLFRIRLDREIVVQVRPLQRLAPMELVQSLRPRGEIIHRRGTFHRQLTIDQVYHRLNRNRAQPAAPMYPASPPRLAKSIFVFAAGTGKARF